MTVSNFFERHFLFFVIGSHVDLYRPNYGKFVCSHIHVYLKLDTRYFPHHQLYSATAGYSSLLSLSVCSKVSLVKEKFIKLFHFLLAFFKNRCHCIICIKALECKQYNLTSVRIIDLVSHTTYVLCVNFIHKWHYLQFKVDS